MKEKIKKLYSHIKALDKGIKIVIHPQQTISKEAITYIQHPKKVYKDGKKGYESIKTIGGFLHKLPVWFVFIIVMLIMTGIAIFIMNGLPPVS